MHKGEHSAILLTIIKLLLVIKIFVLSIFEWPFYTGFIAPEMFVFTGRNLEGIHYAMTFLETWQKKQHGNELEYLKWYAKDKDVIVIGGGDTGCDCIATSLRQVM